MFFFAFKIRIALGKKPPAERHKPLSALRGFSERETQAFQINTKDYKYKTNININLKPKIIAKHLLTAVFLFEILKFTK